MREWRESAWFHCWPVGCLTLLCMRACLLHRLQTCLQLLRCRSCCSGSPYTKLIACCILKQKRCGAVVRFGIPIRRTHFCCPQCRSGKHKTNINNRSTNELMQATQSSTAQAERDASPEAWCCFFQLCISILVVSRSTWMSPTPSRLFLQPLPLRRGIVFSTLHFYSCCIQVDVDVSDSKQAPAVPPTTDAMVAEVIVLFALVDL